MARATNADIDTVLKSIIEDKIHSYDPTRIFSTASLRAKDVMEIGFQQLDSTGLNSPLRKFNSSRMGARRQAPDSDVSNTPDLTQNTQTQDDASVEGEAYIDQHVDVPNEDGTQEEIDLVIAEEENSEPFGLDL
ncbi:hypothetical protein BN14_12015 [Rhizoctonia solani AG-1 IB]|uniref:Uncharacterized protein n=1 Tax=Thanatephorus cucumeris (strain AG1-IB / isolate 7/3/14) TaxID=1108050 RepID=M5CF15_THACB|nr:hypothetical protein BN14_12015 [Rhizoctonia solani AG-1 IB]